MSGRQVIVTGTSPGSLGYETARTLAGWGADVVATCLRNRESLEDSLLGDLEGNGLDADSVTVRRLDLCDADSVAEFAAWYTKSYDSRLHVLINNAGVHKGVFSRKTRPPPAPDGCEVHWRTNYLGPFHLTKLLLPALQRGGRESGDARILNVTSHLHETGTNESLFEEPVSYDAWDAYGTSKLALVHFTFELQRRYAAEYNLQAVAVDPGSVSTNLTRLEIPRGIRWRRPCAGSSRGSMRPYCCARNMAPRHRSCARAGNRCRAAGIMNGAGLARLPRQRPTGMSPGVCGSRPSSGYPHCDPAAGARTHLPRECRCRPVGTTHSGGNVFERILESSEAMRIDAPAGVVWDVLTDAKSYGDWNPFTTRLDTDFEVNSPIHLHIVMGPYRMDRKEWGARGGAAPSTGVGHQGAGSFSAVFEQGATRHGTRRNELHLSHHRPVQRPVDAADHVAVPETDRPGIRRDGPCPEAPLRSHGIVRPTCLSRTAGLPGSL